MTVGARSSCHYLVATNQWCLISEEQWQRVCTPVRTEPVLLSSDQLSFGIIPLGLSAFLEAFLFQWNPAGPEVLFWTWMSLKESSLQCGSQIPGEAAESGPLRRTRPTRPAGSSWAKSLDSNLMKQKIPFNLLKKKNPFNCILPFWCAVFPVLLETSLQLGTSAEWCVHHRWHVIILFLDPQSGSSKFKACLREVFLRDELLLPLQSLFAQMVWLQQEKVEIKTQWKEWRAEPADRWRSGRPASWVRLNGSGERIHPYCQECWDFSCLFFFVFFFLQIKSITRGDSDVSC